jgi:hypothetical protein
LAILAVAVDPPSECFAAVPPVASEVLVAIDGVFSGEVAGIDALEWRSAGNPPLAPLVLHAKLQSGGPLTTWLQASLASGTEAPATKTLELTVIESGKAIDAWRLLGARIAGVEFDDFDASSTASWRYKVTVVASSAVPVAAPLDLRVSGVAGGKVTKPAMQNSFSIAFGTLPTKRISAVRGLAATPGKGRASVSGVLAVSVSDYPAYAKWRSSASTGVQDLVVSMLDSSLHSVIASLRLPSVTLQRITLPIGTPPSLAKFEVGLTASSLLLDVAGMEPTASASAPATPNITPLPSGTLRATVANGQVNHYSATVSGGTQVVSLTGIVGEAKLDVYSDAGFAQPVDCLSPNLYNNVSGTYRAPGDCTFVATAGTVYASVSATSSTAAAQNIYGIRVSPHFDAPAASQGTDKDPIVITTNKPYGGSVGSGASSYYKVDTTGSIGDAVISMTGLTGVEDIGLRIYGNADFSGMLSNPNCWTGAAKTFPESCILPAGTTYYLQVTSTPDHGGPFTLMVDTTG